MRFDNFIINLIETWIECENIDEYKIYYRAYEDVDGMLVGYWSLEKKDGVVIAEWGTDEDDRRIHVKNMFEMLGLLRKMLGRKCDN